MDGSWQGTNVRLEMRVIHRSLLKYLHCQTKPPEGRGDFVNHSGQRRSRVAPVRQLAGLWQPHKLLSWYAGLQSSTCAYGLIVRHAHSAVTAWLSSRVVAPFRYPQSLASNHSTTLAPREAMMWWSDGYDRACLCDLQSKPAGGRDGNLHPFPYFAATVADPCDQTVTCCFAYVVGRPGRPN